MKVIVLEAKVGIRRCAQDHRVPRNGSERLRCGCGQNRLEFVAGNEAKIAVDQVG